MNAMSPSLLALAQASGASAPSTLACRKLPGGCGGKAAHAQLSLRRQRPGNLQATERPHALPGAQTSRPTTPRVERQEMQNRALLAPQRARPICDHRLLDNATDRLSSSAGRQLLSSAAHQPEAPNRRTGIIGRFLPIWYALPSLEAFQSARTAAGELCSRENKPFDFAPMRPGVVKTYTYQTEAAYYGQYARSLFGITGPKAGLDSLRHYQILASGAVPYFLKSSLLTSSPLAMYAFPRQLVSAASHLPGVPSEEVVAAAMQRNLDLHVDNRTFNLSRYCELRAKVIAHTEAYLTTANLARYVLEQMQLAKPTAFGARSRAEQRAGRDDGAASAGQAEPPLAEVARVLMVSSKEVSGDTWQNAFLYHGLASLIGGRLSSWFGRKEVLYADFVYPHGFCCYGRGYSYARTLPTPAVYRHCERNAANALLRDQLQQRLARGYFNLLIVTTHSNKCCGLAQCYTHGSELVRQLNAYIRKMGSRLAVATVDGSDGFGGCGGKTFAAELERIDVHFLREVDARHGGRTATLVRAPESHVVPSGI